MVESSIIIFISFVGFFLALTSLLQSISKKTGFPYTIALLVAGFFCQALFYHVGYEPPFAISNDIIYYIILPILLFEAAIHVNFHEFKMQFWTITFMATFGVLLSILTVGVGLAYLIGIPFEIALLFGALISATDPISVLALFKTLGVPKRLQLLADGESMFNDATAVILFRIIAGFAVASQSFGGHVLVNGIANFLYIFFGSLVFGFIFGWVIAKFIEQVLNDRFVETTLTITLAISSFIISEHIFGLSGVITTVAAGITLGNLGKTKISGGVIHFMHDMWAYVGFISLSIVFFFAALTIDLRLVWNNLGVLGIVVLVVLISRAIGTYGSFALSNRLSVFKTEPNVPSSWQHVLNWGGLRGVIPLVLVYSLPEEFIYKETLFSFTIASLLFTLFVNGLTIKRLLVKFGLHLPQKTEKIINQEQEIFRIEQQKQRLKPYAKKNLYSKAAQSVHKELLSKEDKHKKMLLRLATVNQLTKSLKLQALLIERDTLHVLFFHNYLSEHAFYRFQRELDLQDDALNYPELMKGRGYEKGGFIQTEPLYVRQLKFQKNLAHIPILNIFYQDTEEKIISHYIELYKARILSSDNVLDYLAQIKRYMKDKPEAINAIAKVRVEHIKHRRSNIAHLHKLEKKHPELVFEYQKELIKRVVLRG